MKVVKTERVNFALDAQTTAQLREHREGTGVPVSVFVRRAIEEKLKREQEQVAK